MRCLDSKRLGNQVWREGLTLLGGGWPNHPASKMWRGHEYSLGEYLMAGIQALEERGKYHDNIAFKIRALMYLFKDTGNPPWLGNADFHASHRSNLLRKDPVFYSQYGWIEPTNMPYMWPKNTI